MHTSSSLVGDRSIDRSRERERERALSWKDCAASGTRMEATCCLLAASRIRMQKKSLVVFLQLPSGHYCSKCGKNPQVCKNLGTWKLIGSSHRLCKLSINSALARLLAPLPRTKSKQKLERRSRRTKKKKNQNQKKQKQEEEEEEEEEEYLLRRSEGGFTTSSPSFLTNIVDHNAYRRNRIPEEQLSVEEAASNRSRSQFL
jgi:hypothetical protein